MTKQKRGLWLFLASLIPGAGEMYMGFLKKGLSIMLMFWGIAAFCAAVGFEWFLFFWPIIWFYSFFDTHNLKSLSEEEFYSLEDDYVLHIGQFLPTANALIMKYHTIFAVILIIFGASILMKNFVETLEYILPDFLANTLFALSYNLPQIAIAAAIIIAGFYILAEKKHRLNDSRDADEEEHYWEPYRPYSQSNTLKPEAYNFQGNTASQESMPPKEAPAPDKNAASPESPAPQENLIP